MFFLKKIKSFVLPGLFQFSIAILLLLFIFVYDALGLPDSQVISEYFIEAYEKYGLVIIIVASFLEALFMLSMYLPASLVIVLSAFALGFDIQTLFQIGLLSLLGFTLANIFNYYLGKYGYYKILLKLGGKESIEKIQHDFNNNQFKTVFFTAFHPNFLAITMVSAGISKSNLFKVLLQSIVSLSFWIVLWMGVISLLFKGQNFNSVENENIAYYFVLILLVWGLLKCFVSDFKKG